MKRYEPKRWQATAKERKDVAEMNSDHPEPPKQTFTDSPHVITDGTRRVEFRFFGWAHTRGDGFVYLPKERVLCTGDAVVNGPYNYHGRRQHRQLAQGGGSSDEVKCGSRSAWTWSRGRQGGHGWTAGFHAGTA